MSFTLFPAVLTESLHQGPVLNEEYLAINDELRYEFLAKQRDRKYCAMREFRTKLPAFDKCQDILDKISENQVLVISGETGCGKTTQVCISRVEGVGEGEGGGIVVVIGGCTMF